jgi:hypothetical protein
MRIYSSRSLPAALDAGRSAIADRKANDEKPSVGATES